MTLSLEITGLSHSFGSLEVLREIDLKVAAGEFVSIVGPSGSGKSTLFHLIGGLLTPSGGEIKIDGTPSVGTRGQIAYMPQQPALMPWRTVRANVSLANEIAGAPRTNTTAWLEKVGLAAFSDSYPHELSGGMQQRVAFARALSTDKSLICLDEPFSALDAMLRTEMHRWLLDLWEADRRAILFVTHNIEEALLLSDSVYVFTRRPATVLERVDVPFPRPRRDEVVDDPEFVRLRRRLTTLLQGTT